MGPGPTLLTPKARMVEAAAAAVNSVIVVD